MKFAADLNTTGGGRPVFSATALSGGVSAETEESVSIDAIVR